MKSANKDHRLSNVTYYLSPYLLSIRIWMHAGELNDALSWLVGESTDLSLSLSFPLSYLQQSLMLAPSLVTLVSYDTVPKRGGHKRELLSLGDDAKGFLKSPKDEE